MPELIDYEAVLGDLEAKRSAIDTAIAGIRQMLALGTQITPGMPLGRPAEPTTIESDTFFGLSIGEGAKKYLRMVKRKQSAKTIADALDKGGLQHTSRFFPNTVRTSLIRLEQEGEVVQVGKEWGLTEWYPGYRKGGKASTGEKDAKSPADGEEAI